MAAQRKKALEQAKLLQYNENDRVKNFHVILRWKFVKKMMTIKFKYKLKSGLKLSEVLKEREKQIEMKEIIKHIHAEQDKEFDEKQRIYQLEKDKAEAINSKKKGEKYEEVTGFIKKQ